MILLRCLSILIGSIVLFAAPFLLLPEAPQRPADDGLVVLVACASLLLSASGFFFVGIAGHRMKRSRRLRTVAAGLLAFPMFAGSWAMFSGEKPELLWIIGLLLCLAFGLFVAFVFPAARIRAYRPLRPRELLEGSAN